MALLAMPLLMLNLGGEMIYILEQRLQAQSIDSEKGRKVLHDIVSSLLNVKFVDELFKPQEISSTTAVRGVFDRIAHSSIMRLSESSMEKLYDLMTMGFKYQLVCSRFPQELIDITKNHYNSIKSFLGVDPINTKIDAVIKRVNEHYNSLQAGEMFFVKQALLRFVQDKKVKVSLFLQNSLQNQQGILNIPQTGAIPPFADIPGTIKTFDLQRSFIHLTGSQSSVIETTFNYPLKLEKRTKENSITKLGLNLYSVPKALPVSTSIMSSSPIKIPEPESRRNSVSSNSPIGSAEKHPHQRRENMAAEAEINMLVNLIGGNKYVDNDLFRVKDLFNDKRFDTSDDGDIFRIKTIQIDAAKAQRNEELKRIMKSLVENDNEEQDEQSEEQRELLDLISL